MRQVIHNCGASEKEDKLVELLTGLPSEASIMIFCNKKRDCEYISAGAIHSARPNLGEIWLVITAVTSSAASACALSLDVQTFSLRALLALPVC